ncbi:peptide deformylase [Skeletonema marinoi]|uniref:Peptide deformylase n=1 Tax=Skeletonema marinoi TaxID=267567 RepID=A0AAD9D855_9STRA|nr:peptide deformylase [Skeletonema marinoi]
MPSSNSYTNRMASAIALCAVAASSRRALVSAFSTPSMMAAASTRTKRPSSSFSFPQISLPSSRLFSTTEEVDPGVVEGTDLRVLKYPHPSLRAPNDEIADEELTGPGCGISKIAKEMFLVMYATNGVGLAAPQVGINKRLMVYNEHGDPKKWMSEVIMINPRIVEFSEASDVEEEGCLSFPDMGGDVERSKWIKVEAQNLKGKKIKKKFRGWEARIFQHEYDHLDGKVYIDRLTEDGRKEIQPKLDELIDTFGEGGAL